MKKGDEPMSRKQSNHTARKRLGLINQLFLQLEKLKLLHSDLLRAVQGLSVANNNKDIRRDLEDY